MGGGGGVYLLARALGGVYLYRVYKTKRNT